MAKDERFYMKFVNDFHRHPKLIRLSPEVRWAFVEMVGEARIADNDGVFDADDAEFMWNADVLAALLKSHPSRPLVTRDADGRYVIRDYAKHQQTRADRESLSEKRSRAASERWAKAKQGDASAQQAHSKPKQPHAESESESESELERPIPTELVGLGSNAREQTDSEEEPETVEAMLRLAQTQKLDLKRIIRAVDEECGRTLDHATAYRFAMHVISKSKTHVGNRQAYVMKAVTNDPAECQQWIDQEAA